MSKQLNVEITTQKERDALIEQLQKMQFKKDPVKTWEKLKTVDGFWIGSSSTIFTQTAISTRDLGNKNIFKTEKQAKSALAYAQLTQLMAEANGDWEPDWNSGFQKKYAIVRSRNLLVTDKFTYTYEFLNFKSKKIAEQFLCDHRDLIKEFYQI
jgi:hypothetical protein